MRSSFPTTFPVDKPEKSSRYFASACDYPADQNLKNVNRRAVLIFADPTALDLARRRFPRYLRPLLSVRRLFAAAAAADFHLFSSRELSAGHGIECHLQQGETFAERLERATEKLSALGYEEIVVVGSDCPRLSTADIASAFRELATRRLVLGPDHRGGCYLIALRAVDRDLLRGVRWNRNSDYAQLRHRVAPGEVISLAVKQDVDNWADVRLLARAGYALAEFVIALLQVAQITRDSFVDLCAQALRVRGQMPPPAFAA